MFHFILLNLPGIGKWCANHTNQVQKILSNIVFNHLNGSPIFFLQGVLRIIKKKSALILLINKDNYNKAHTEQRHEA